MHATGTSVTHRRRRYSAKQCFVAGRGRNRKRGRAVVSHQEHDHPSTIDVATPASSEVPTSTTVAVDIATSSQAECVCWWCAANALGTGSGSGQLLPSAWRGVASDLDTGTPHVDGTFDSSRPYGHDGTTACAWGLYSAFMMQSSVTVIDCVKTTEWVVRAGEGTYGYLDMYAHAHASAYAAETWDMTAHGCYYGYGAYGSYEYGGEHGEGYAAAVGPAGCLQMQCGGKGGSQRARAYPVTPAGPGALSSLPPKWVQAEALREWDIAHAIRRALKCPRLLPAEDRLHVVAVVSNPVPYMRRYMLAQEFMRRMETMESDSVILYVVELAYGSQPHVLTQASNPRHLQLRADGAPIWHKENLINIGIQRLLPATWKAVAWIDADVEFESHTWATDALRLLNGAVDIVQLFSHAVDMDQHQHAMSVFPGFAYQVCRRLIAAPNMSRPGWVSASNAATVPAPATSAGSHRHEDVAERKEPTMAAPKVPHAAPQRPATSSTGIPPLPPRACRPAHVGALAAPGNINLWHPGFAWAMSRRLYDAVGGLYQLGAVGSGDNVMAHCCIREWTRSVHPDASPGYRRSIREWQARLPADTKLGYVPGVLWHFFHGRKVNRKYMDRWKILVHNQYDPYEHVQPRESDGLLQLTPACPPAFATELMQYFTERDEDEGLHCHAPTAS
jgi:hypothetical protein